MLAGCGSDVKGDHADLVNGKVLFVQRCGACHTLARAGTRGTVGPDLDDAFSQSISEGFKRSVINGVVKEQILYPSVSGKMPAKLVTGQDAVDIAAYVAASAAKPGEDTGALASAVRSTSQRTAAAQAGKLEIDANPDGQLAYEVSSATSGAGLAPDRLEKRLLHPARHRAAGGHRRQSARRGRDRLQRRRLDRVGRPQTRQIHVLLHAARPSRGRHAGHAHRQITARERAGGGSMRGAPEASCSREASQKNHETATTIITMSSVIISPPAVRWSASGAIPSRMPRP